MLFLRLGDLGPTVPQDIQERLRTAYSRNMFHNLANTAELICILQIFEQDGIPAMPFKGVVLGASAYGNLTTRPPGDLDVLIHSRHRLRAATILQQRGYELTGSLQPEDMPPARGQYEYHFERQSDGMVVELCWRLELVESRFRRDLGLDWVWPGRRTAVLADAEVLNMSSEKTLLMLCMHGSKHVWSRLIWICDVAQLLVSSPDLDWRETMQEAKRSGLWRALALGILLAHRVTGAEVPQAILQRCQTDTTAFNLAQHIEENLFDAPGSRPAGRIPYNVKLLGFHDRLRLITSLDLMRPSEHDQAILSQQRPSSLSYLIRPFRLLWDKSAR